MKYKGLALVIGIALLLSLAVVGCSGEPPLATVSNHSVSPNPSIVGRPAAISIDVANNNKGTETFTIKLWIDNVVVTNTTDITLEPGAMQKVTFYYTPTDTGNCMVTMGQYAGGLIGWSFNAIEAAE
jgi:hypothetical protein